MITGVNLIKLYKVPSGIIEALPQISFDIGHNECVLLTGPSGSGKTTLMNIIGCLLRPSSGSLILKGKDVSNYPDHFLAMIRRKDIGFVFQQFNLLSGCTVLQNIEMPLIPEGITKKERERRVFVILDKLNMLNRASSNVNDLSGGEQQRVSIARSLINDPHIILADEPTSNVDEDNAISILELFYSLKNSGKTLIISSHDHWAKRHPMFDREIRMSHVAKSSFCKSIKQGELPGKKVSVRVGLNDDGKDY